MKKYLILLLIALGSFVSVHAQKFALIDMEYIMRNIPAYERAGEQLNQISKKWQAEVEALDNEAKTLYRNYQNEAVFLSEAQKKDREDKIVKKEKAAADLKKKYFGPEGEVYNAVKAVAQAKGFQLILDRASEGAGIIFASPAIDISNEVLAKLGYSN